MIGKGIILVVISIISATTSFVFGDVQLSKVWNDLSTVEGYVKSIAIDENNSQVVVRIAVPQKGLRTLTICSEKSKIQNSEKINLIRSAMNHGSLIKVNNTGIFDNCIGSVSLANAY